MHIKLYSSRTRTHIVGIVTYDDNYTKLDVTMLINISFHNMDTEIAIVGVFVCLVHLHCLFLQANEGKKTSL